jgi:hypothetical protein
LFFYNYAQAVLKFTKLNTAAQQHETVVQERSLSPYRLRYNIEEIRVGDVFIGADGEDLN